MLSCDEKKAPADLLPLVAPAPSTKKAARFRTLLIALGFILCTLKSISIVSRSSTLLPYILEDSNHCPQTGLILPRKNRKLWKDLGKTIGSNGFQARAVDWLGDAVRIPLVLFSCFLLSCLNFTYFQNRIFRQFRASWQRRKMGKVCQIP